MSLATAASTPTRRWLRWLVRLLIVLFLAALLAGGWFAYHCATVALRAEENLHASLFTIRLVDEFVRKHGRWPRSWHELEQVKTDKLPPDPDHEYGANDGYVRNGVGGCHGYDWPKDSPHIQECVQIDFNADPKKLIDEPTMQFSAIKPIGPYFEYRDYGFVDELKKTLRERCVETKRN